MRTTDIRICAAVNNDILGLSFISTDAVISGLCVAFSITIGQLYLDNNRTKRTKQNGKHKRVETY
jgi:hypothetical protein